MEKVLLAKLHGEGVESVSQSCVHVSNNPKATRKCHDLRVLIMTSAQRRYNIIKIYTPYIQYTVFKQRWESQR